VTLVDHLVLNSPGQWRRARPIVDAARAAGHKVSCGLRVNHEHQEVEVALYDPAGPFSRLGTTRANLQPEDLDGLDGLHFHTLCQLGADALERALDRLRGQVRRVHRPDEVGQLRRRPPHHAARLRRRSPGRGS
jgi:carboxynorspermidine decarboxylase